MGLIDESATTQNTKGLKKLKNVTDFLPLFDGVDTDFDANKLTLEVSENLHNFLVNKVDNELAEFNKDSHFSHTVTSSLTQYSYRLKAIKNGNPNNTKHEL
jgi:hypothetical protein